MFKFRFGGQGGSSPAQAPTIEAVRRRARHRLIGAFVLVLAGVIGFPLLFESQPRPVPANFEIDIPAKSAVKPLAPPATPAVPAAGVRVEGLDDKEEVLASAAPPVVAPSKADAVPSVPHSAAQAVAPARPEPAAKPEPVTRPEPAAKPAERPHASAESKPETKAVAKPEAKAEAKPAEKKPVEKKPAEHKVADKPAKSAGDADRAQALLEGKSAAQQRIVVQVGAFADADRAREARQQLERAGLTTYTNVADTPAGKRTRVRVGPFATRAEADKAAAKIKALGLPAAILSL